MNSEQKYSIRYTLESESKKEGFSKEEIASNQRLCDAYIFVPIIYPPDGSYGEIISSYSGNTNKELTDRDLFKHLCCLMMKLTKSEKLLSWQKIFVCSSSDLLQKFMKGIN